MQKQLPLRQWLRQVLYRKKLEQLLRMVLTRLRTAVLR